MTDEQINDDLDVARIGEELQSRVPAPQSRWQAELGEALDIEARRRAIGGHRPRLVWARAGVLLIVGSGLLTVAATRL